MSSALCEWKIIQTDTGEKVARPCTGVLDPGPDPAWIRIQLRPSKPWIRIGIQPKMPDPDPYQMNKDPKPCLVLKSRNMVQKCRITTYFSYKFYLIYIFW